MGFGVVSNFSFFARQSDARGYHIVFDVRIVQRNVFDAGIGVFDDVQQSIEWDFFPEFDLASVESTVLRRFDVFDDFLLLVNVYFVFGGQICF